MVSKSLSNFFKVPLALMVLILLLDALLKSFIHFNLPQMSYGSYFYPYGGIAVFKDFMGIEFSISHAINLGAAWGVGRDYQILILIFRIFLILGLAVYFFLFRKTFLEQIFVSLILAGALGNVIDYFLYGHVVDMFHFVLFGYDFPVFNLADSAIFVGVAGYILTSWKFAKTA